MPARCPIGDYLTLCAEALNLSPDRVLRRAGLSGEVLSEADVHVPPQT